MKLFVFKMPYNIYPYTTLRIAETEDEARESKTGNLARTSLGPVWKLVDTYTLADQQIPLKPKESASNEAWCDAVAHELYNTGRTWNFDGWKQKVSEVLLKHAPKSNG